MRGKRTISSEHALKNPNIHMGRSMKDALNTLATYSETLALMKRLKEEGVKILFFCGGEVFLWTRSKMGLIRISQKKWSMI